MQSLERDANQAKQALAAAATEFKRLPTAIDTRNATENGEVLRQTHRSLSEWISGIQTAMAGFESVFVDPVAEKALGQFFAAIAAWRERREAHRKQYEDAKTRAAQHEEALRQIQTLEARLAELNETADVKSQQLIRLGDPNGDFASLRTDWKSTHRKRAELLDKQCIELTALSKSRLRASPAAGGRYRAAG